MKLRALALIFIIAFLTIQTSSVFVPSGDQELVESSTPAGFAPNEYIAVDGWGEGIGGFTETNNYANTWYNDSVSYYLSDSLAIYMILMVQLPVLSFEYYDSITFTADWRFKASSSDNGYWALGNSTGDIVAAHNSIYSVTTTDTGYEDVEISLDIDTDVINAQNSTGHLSFIMTGAGGNTYEIWCDKAFLTLEYEDDFASQTVDGDTYLTPDPTQFLAVDGWGDGIGGFTETNDYTDTWSNDGTSHYVSDSLAVYIIMIMQLPDVSKFDNIVFHADWRYTASASDDGVWALGFGNGSIVAAHNNVYSYTGTDSTWEESEVSLPIDADVVTAQNETGHISFIMTSAGVNTYELYCDFAFLSLERNYVESYSNLSEWVFNAESGGTSYDFSTNGDVLNASLDFVGAGNDYFQYDAPIEVSLESYIEFYYRAGGTVGVKAQLRIYLNSSSDTWVELGQFSTTTWSTVKLYLPDYISFTPTNILLHIDDNDNAYASGGGWIQTDYLIIRPADEFGYSFDGSTTNGVSELGGSGVTYTSPESDGDELTFGVERTSGSGNVWAGIKILFDTSTTAFDIESDYYPFYELSWSIDGCDADAVYFQIYADSKTVSGSYHTAPRALTSDVVNIEGGSGHTLAEIRIVVRTDTVGEGANITIDLFQAYSIANYSISQSSVTSDDYLYVYQGLLYSSMNSGSIVLEYDPTFLLNGSYSWNKSTSYGDSYLSFYHNAAWKAYSGNTTGEIVGGTTTGYRIMFNETANVIDIQFTAIPPTWWTVNTVNLYFDTPAWNTASVAILRFNVALMEWAIDFFLMLSGLVMIPLSTLFLVKGRREEMSIDKLLIFLLVFFIGWGLFLGGLL